MYDDDEATQFEMNPLGARQRMLPSRTFLSRHPAVPAPLHAPAMAAATARPVQLQARVEMPVRVTPLPAPMMLLPREIHYPDALDELISSSSAALPAADSSVMTALPVASRRFRWIAAPLVSLLALALLGGALWPQHEVQGPSIAPEIAATDEAIAPGVDIGTANEDPAPIEEEAPKPKRIAKRVIAAPVVAAPTKRAGKPRAVTVNTSSALGNLRVKKAW